MAYRTTEPRDWTSDPLDPYRLTEETRDLGLAICRGTQVGRWVGGWVGLLRLCQVQRSRGGGRVVDEMSVYV